MIPQILPNKKIENAFVKPGLTRHLSVSAGARSGYHRAAAFRFIFFLFAFAS